MGIVNPPAPTPAKGVVWATTNVGGSVNADLVPVVWNTQLGSIGSTIVLNGSRIEFPVGGTFKLSANIHTTSTVARVNIQLIPRLNGTTLVPGRGSSGYIRAATGHNQGSSHANYALEAAPGDFVEFVGQREANTGNGTLVANSSFLIVEEI